MKHIVIHQDTERLEASGMSHNGEMKTREVKVNIVLIISVVFYIIENLHA